jgi:hypothetical protein
MVDESFTCGNCGHPSTWHTVRLDTGGWAECHGGKDGCMCGLLVDDLPDLSPYL